MVTSLHSTAMGSPPCFALSSTSFKGRPVQTPLICKLRAPARVAVRRPRAQAVEPDAGAASDSEKVVDVMEGDAPAPEPIKPVSAEPVKPASAEPVQPASPEPVAAASDDFVDRVPGKIVLDEIALAKQRKALEEYAAELRKERIEKEREAARLFGFVPFAETLNGRLAMFFFVTGLLTEYWTGYTIPEQIEIIARTLGIL